MALFGEEMEPSSDGTLKEEVGDSEGGLEC